MYDITYGHTQVYSWGYNGNGEVGIGSTNQQLPKPIRTLDNQVISKVIKYRISISHNYVNVTVCFLANILKVQR